MKLDKKYCVARMYTDRWYILPTVIIQGDDHLYMDRNFTVEFHFLCFHARLMWVEKGHQG